MNQPVSEPRSEAGLRAWTFLFGALALAAGHGVFLFAALRDSGALGNLGEVGRGRLGSLALLWLVAAPVLSLLALFLRRPLARSRRLPALALLAVLATAGSFWFYLTAVVRVT